MITSICTIGTSHSVRDVGPVQSEATQKKMLLKNGTGGLTMAEYIKRETLLERAEYDNNYRLIIPAEVIKAAPAADVAPIEALEHLRDELCAQDLITMEGLRKLNTLIWKYTTAHDGGADHDA